MARAGGTQRTQLGVVAFTSVEPVDVATLTADDAREAGFDSLAALLEAQGSDGEGAIYRIELHLAGPDPRVALRSKLDSVASTPRASRAHGRPRPCGSSPSTRAAVRATSLRWPGWRCSRSSATYAS